jgi:predicted aspartyl protease
MRTKGANGVGRFAVDFDVANFEDMALVRRGHLRADQVRRKSISGWVDSGATALVLPKAVADELGLQLGDPINVRSADGRRARRREAEGVYVELLGRHNIFNALVEPKRDSALIGAVVLEILDFLVDCKHGRLVPRDPSGRIYEIE